MNVELQDGKVVRNLTLEQEDDALLEKGKGENYKITYQNAAKYSKWSKVCPKLSLVLLVALSFVLAGVSVYYMIITPRINRDLTSLPNFGYMYQLPVSSFQASNTNKSELGDVQGVYKNIRTLKSFGVQTIVMSGRYFGSVDYEDDNDNQNGPTVKENLITESNKIGVSLGTFVNRDDIGSAKLLERYKLLTYATVILDGKSSLNSSLDVIEFWSNWVKAQSRMYVQPSYGLFYSTALVKDDMNTIKTLGNSSLGSIDFVVFSVDIIPQLGYIPAWEKPLIYWSPSSMDIKSTSGKVFDEDKNNLNLALSLFLPNGTNLYMGDELLSDVSMNYEGIFTNRSNQSKQTISFLKDVVTMRKYFSVWKTLGKAELMYASNPTRLGVSNSSAKIPVYVRKVIDSKLYSHAILVQNSIQNSQINFDLTEFTGVKNATLGEVFMAFPSQIRFESPQKINITSVVLGYGFSAYVLVNKNMPVNPTPVNGFILSRDI